MNELSPYQSLRRRPAVYSELTDELGRHFLLQSYDLKNTRELRTLLLDAAYVIQSQPEFTDVHVYLHNCTLARKRIELEFEQFKRIARANIMQRILIHDLRNIKPDEHLVMRGQAQVGDTTSRKPASASQEAVLAYLLQRHLQAKPGVSIGTIATATKASLPTIYKVLNAYAHCIEREPEDKLLSLRNFSNKDWLYWMQRTNRLSSVCFIDHSGAPRSATKLAKGLARLQRDDLAVGGLMGALHHLPALDATSSPQLDILVHGTRRTDLSFIKEIDPGLEQHSGRAELAHVVVHFIDRPNPLFERQGGHNWGALPDCIANMQKAGLTHQVNDALLLIQQGHQT